MQYGKMIIVSALAASLAACTTTTPSNTKIVNETQPPRLSKEVSVSSVNPVRVPSNLSSSNIQNSYQVPETPTPGSTGEQQNTTLAPPGSNLAQATSATTQPQSTQPAAAPAPAPAPAVSVPAKPAGVTGNSLTLNVGYDQAWSKVGKGLPSAGYPVMEQDNSSGTYYVLDKVSSGGVIKRDTPIYQVHLEKQGAKATTVTVVNPQNQQAAPSGVTSRILSALKNSM
ncbi:MAG TPA: hypothetical protein VHE99_09700 [Gammaproteobacteria bacterium]|nr:hypothetical protein [Gammaproteobacteria bacterium]